MGAGSENQAEQVCRYFENCTGCVHCTDLAEVCRYCWGDEEEECDHCTDYFTSCEQCGAFGIPVDASGMASDLCPQCEGGK